MRYFPWLPHTLKLFRLVLRLDIPEFAKVLGISKLQLQFMESGHVEIYESMWPKLWKLYHKWMPIIKNFNIKTFFKKANKRGLTIVFFAKKLNIGKRAFSYYVEGKYVTNILMIVKLKKIYDEAIKMTDIRKEIKKAGNQSLYAAKLGVSISTVSRWMNKNRKPNLEKIMRLRNEDIL